MLPRKKLAKTTRTTVTIDTRELEKFIRDSIRSELDANQSRKHTADAYTQRLHETDAKTAEFIQQAINETTRAYRLSIDSLVIGYLAASFILVAGVVLAILSTNNPGLFTIAILFIAIGVIWIINLQNRNLIKNNRSLVNNLAKLNIIFTGYIRQIQQVDRVFEELAGSSQGITVQTAEQLLNNLQEAMTEAMNSVSAISMELEE